MQRKLLCFKEKLSKLIRNQEFETTEILERELIKEIIRTKNTSDIYDDYQFQNFDESMYINTASRKKQAGERTIFDDDFLNHNSKVKQAPWDFGFRHNHVSPFKLHDPNKHSTAESSKVLQLSIKKERLKNERNGFNILPPFLDGSTAKFAKENVDPRHAARYDSPSRMLLNFKTPEKLVSSVSKAYVLESISKFLDI